jgi:hypothetical protein
VVVIAVVEGPKVVGDVAVEEVEAVEITIITTVTIDNIPKGDMPIRTMAAIRQELL